MRRQIEHLQTLADNGNDNLYLQAMPFTEGIYEGLGIAFTIYLFKGSALPDLVYFENAEQDSIYKDDREIIQKYQDRFWKLWEIAKRKAEDGRIKQQFISDLTAIKSSLPLE